MTKVEAITWNAHARVDKFTAEQEAEAKVVADRDGITLSQALLRLEPYEVAESEGNLLTRLGRKRLMDRFTEVASNSGITAAKARIGVGNSSTAAVDTDTDLVAAAGAANRQFELVDSAPTVGSGVDSGKVTLVATFETTDANFVWNEWGIDGGTADGTTVTADTNTTPGLINRKVASLGTKTSAAAWVFTVTITIT
jgi:hypothetical protein